MMNVMRKTIICATLAAVLGLLTVSCSKFLNVNPKGEVFDDDMFSSDEGFQDALYGVYSELGSTTLYEGYFVSMPETMSWNFSTSHYQLGNMAICDWTNNGPQSIRLSLWTTVYKAINHLNNIVEHTEESVKGVKNMDFYRGEALALRALLHFELMRYFGPPFWAPESAKEETIPYVTVYAFEITPYGSYDEVYAKIISELKEAETLLAGDSEYVPAVRTNSATGFFDARITHMNLYAVQALLARVYWTMDDLENASVYAKKVIDSGKFSFRPLSAFIQTDNGTLDLNETIFGVYSENQNTLKSLFGLGGTGSTTAALAADALDLYTTQSSSTKTDYRLSAWFDSGDETCTKMVNTVYYNSSSSSYTGKSILGVSVLRIPEMYFIMSEYYLESDNAEAVKYFDDVITTRGLDSFAETSQALTRDRLFDERRKEFYGEGFTWHEMKKLQKDIVTTWAGTKSGSDYVNYTVPLPEDEEEHRSDIYY